MADGEGCRRIDTGSGDTWVYLRTFRGFKGYLWSSLNLIKKVLAFFCEQDLILLRSFKFVLFLIN